MDGLEIRFNITRGGTLKKHLGVDYVWGFDEKQGKHFVKATMIRKLVLQLINWRDSCISKRTPGKPSQYLQKMTEMQ